MKPALLINGTVGVGKSTTADRIGGLLATAERPGAVLDLDALRYAWPQPPDDPFSLELCLTNLASVSTNLRAAGHDHLVLAGVVETALQREAFEAALGAELIIVRLTGPGELVDERIRRRQRDDEAGIAWHLRRRPELEQILVAAGIDDHVVDIAGRTPEQVAAQVLALAYPDTTA